MLDMLHTLHVTLENSDTFPRLKTWVILPSLFAFPGQTITPVDFALQCVSCLFSIFQDPSTTFIASSPENCNRLLSILLSLVVLSLPKQSIFTFLPVIILKQSSDHAITLLKNFQWFPTAYEVQTPHVIQGVPYLSPASLSRLLFSSHIHSPAHLEIALFSEHRPPSPTSAFCICLHSLLF